MTTKSANKTRRGQEKPDSSAKEKEKAAESLLRKISLQAYAYNEENTKTLTSLLDSDTEPSLSFKTFALCQKTSKKALYVTERDHVRYKDHKAKADEKPFIPFAKDYARIIHSPSFRRLQGKSQLIPAGENEFFRTRLTHSLEVSDIALRIARKINAEHPYFKKHNLDLDLLSCACLLHDIGHPPFGHSGEVVLNELMRECGGFEGNAQTLRLVTTLENRLGSDVEIKEAYQQPRGLNLTARTLASIIKYDKQIVMKADEDGNYKVQKGYYESEAEVVKFVKEQLGLGSGEVLRTVECQIMDIADDIAYSAYDLEDTMEAGIVLPFDLMSLHDDDLDKIGKDVNKQLAKKLPEPNNVDKRDVLVTLIGVFDSILEFNKKNAYNLAEESDQNGYTVPNDRIVFVGRSYGESALHAENPLIRRQFLETLIQRNINAVTAELNVAKPFMSKIRIDYDRLIVIECLKAFNFHKVIATKKIQMAQYRSKKVLKSIFKALFEDRNKGYLLSDEQRRYLKCVAKKDNDPAIYRFICDIIANFTDHEALHLFNKLNGNGKFFDYAF